MLLLCVVDVLVIVCLVAARAAFLPKEEDNLLEPAAYRVLLMLPATYRLWARTRLKHLEPWVMAWATEEMFSGAPGQGAADAAYMTAMLVEQCMLHKEDYTGGAADVYKCFDQIQRPLMYKLLRRGGMPEKGNRQICQILRSSIG